MATSVFGSTKITAPKKNIFDLSHSVKFTTNAGYLDPVACIPVVPGDSFDIKADVFCRLAPLTTPVLANMDVRLEAFYCSNRILWPNWDKFIVFEHRPQDDPKPSFPYLDMGQAKAAQDSDNYNRVGIGSLADYLGLPVTQFEYSDSKVGEITQNRRVSALPFAAYQRVWLDYYCDRNIQQSLINTYYGGVDGKGGLYDGDNTSRFLNLMTRHHRMWRKDYFTSALPDAQRGSDVLLPVTGGAVSIEYGMPDDFTPDRVVPESPASNTTTTLRKNYGDSSLPADALTMGTSSSQIPASIDNSDKLSGNVEGLNATITDLRTAMATQRLLELSMRVGSRLKEQLLGIFGVKSSDSRLDRAEYLGGASIPIMIGEVAQTSSTDATSPQANMAGKGIAAGQLSYGRKYFEEHGYLLIIASIVPKAAYFQGMPRHFKNFDMEDFFWPMFQHIGEQAIRNEEIYFGTSDENNQATFGYAPRYSDYKWMPSTVHGEFRQGSLTNMHLARIFASRPYLNADFLNISASSVNRVFAVTSNDYDHFWLDVYLKIKAKRPLDYFGSPR